MRASLSKIRLHLRCYSYKYSSKCKWMLLPVLTSVGMAPLAHAGSMYIYKDNSGQVLLTNVSPSGNFGKFNKKVKVTYYPDSQPQNASNVNSQYPSNYNGYSAPSTSANRNAFDAYIRASAARHGVDPALMKAMMHTESAFNPNARSPVGAQGLMQLMPATARRFSVTNAWNPAENIEGAAKYIAWLTRRFKGNMEHVVAGYNAGEGNVEKYGGIPPFRETQNYVKQVFGRYNNIYKNDGALLGSNISSDSGDVTISGSGSASIMPASYSPNNNSSVNGNYAQSAYAALR